ncbi:MAG: hypothetical protein EAZ74_06040 [Alphaproteobacteria bacterium]|nr:MAG: hypothetical protein EAY76_05760 [Alphaproteobacteria bacterium]TAF13261.1 MAG: hypothetical protein EAZ74_06040 [Alphaproteobacteria bacterium]TAF77312.1 MAG: hypothetical protein EAZ52_00745 [Alphaproteobacteria bacterium]
MIAVGISDSDGSFNLGAFLATLIALTFPVWIYWAGVWIWGFGYILRTIAHVGQFSKKLLHWSLIFLTVGLASASVAFILSSVGVKIPPSAYGILAVIIIAGVRQQKDKLGSDRLAKSRLFITTFVVLLASALAYTGGVYIRSGNRSNTIMEELEAKYPVYKSIRVNEPILYEKIKTNIVNGVKDNKSTTEINNSISPIIIEYVQNKLPYVADEIIVGQLY